MTFMEELSPVSKMKFVYHFVLVTLTVFSFTQVSFNDLSTYSILIFCIDVFTRVVVSGIYSQTVRNFQHACQFKTFVAGHSLDVQLSVKAKGAPLSVFSYVLVGSAKTDQAVDPSLIPSLVKPFTVKLLPCLTLSIKGTVWKTSRQVYLLCCWERHLAGFPHLRVVDRWPATLKRARYSALIAFS